MAGQRRRNTALAVAHRKAGLARLPRFGGGGGAADGRSRPAARGAATPLGGVMSAGTPVRNPFESASSIGASNYCRPDGRRLARPDGRRASALTEFVHDGFRALVLNEHFVCVGAKAAVRQNSYRFGLYPGLGSPAAAAGVARDLFAFVQER